jgi:hypothetical protein
MGHAKAIQVSVGGVRGFVLASMKKKCVEVSMTPQTIAWS